MVIMYHQDPPHLVIVIITILGLLLMVGCFNYPFLYLSLPFQPTLHISPVRGGGGHHSFCHSFVVVDVTD